jgi:hypothetical protein
MARWLVQLEGYQFDLEEFPNWFPDGDVYAIEENGSVYLVGPAFEGLLKDSQVYKTALQQWTNSQLSSLYSGRVSNVLRWEGYSAKTTMAGAKHSFFSPVQSPVAQRLVLYSLWMVSRRPFSVRHKRRFYYLVRGWMAISNLLCLFGVTRSEPGHGCTAYLRRLSDIWDSRCKRPGFVAIISVSVLLVRQMLRQSLAKMHVTLSVSSHRRKTQWISKRQLHSSVDFCKLHWLARRRDNRLHPT